MTFKVYEMEVVLQTITIVFIFFITHKINPNKENPSYCFHPLFYAIIPDIVF